ncbi:preprotein translocase subunit SecG [Ancylomarina sp. 16SWW S1-10-2]|uniref:preprotein translocase subunit SecG n=1 Tax=Ancylomarina sp. 16SWW S1-10-2 TaxID=2499681 RepID=UPI0012AE00E1|nr:preprotein translocase subunit SecG [Ancylomarina sp. 16SWW S1-10-2]MRT94746.1 preprotein translocase subunit SecG [Ancylomarina sp. 16SWW S1-10-2]
MFTFILIVSFILCVLMVLIVLVQNSKGGGLASNFSSSNQIMGVKKTTDFLEKATWGLALAIFALCLGAAATIDHGTNVPKSAIEQELLETETAPATPAFPTEAPVKPTETEKAE